jgi:hypothetical protein
VIESGELSRSQHFRLHGAGPGLFHLEPQITELKEVFSNLKLFILNAFSCGPEPPNENALGARPFSLN